MKTHISNEAKVTIDKWKEYSPLEKHFQNLFRKPSGKKGNNFPEMHRVIMNLKECLRGVHHHVIVLQDYLNKYCSTVST